MDQKQVLCISNFSFAYEKGTRILYPEIEIFAGEVCHLAGASGSGKTTLLHLIFGLLEGGEGVFDLFGRRLSKTSKVEKIALRTFKIGFAAQRPLFVKALTIKENIALAAWSRREEFNEALLLEKAHQLKLDGFLNKFPDELSLGQLQRAQILKLLCYNYELLVLDEPSVSLDNENRAVFWDLVNKYISEANRSLLVVSHGREFDALHIDKTFEL